MSREHGLFFGAQMIFLKTSLVFVKQKSDEADLISTEFHQGGVEVKHLGRFGGMSRATVRINSLVGG